MEKFLLIIREDLANISTLTDSQRAATIREMMGWVEGLAASGHYVDGDALVATGRYVQKDAVLSDGPFIEAKEGVSGITYFRANDLDHAVMIAQTCPLVQKGTAAIEVRPILPPLAHG